MTLHTEPEFRYKTPIAYKEFERFLNQPRTVTDRRGLASRPFSLNVLFQRIGVNQAFLKGSTVMQWQRRQLHPDIDLQFDPVDQSFPSLHQRLHHFVSEHDPAGRIETLNRSPWFSKVSQTMGEAWQRGILSLGYPSSQHSKIDLNCTSNRFPVHDTLNASKAVYFDTRKREAFEIHSWSPKLVEWVRQHNLMWFEPEIDQGLSRLSYRICKRPDLKLLQPGLARLFLLKAEQAEVAQIGMRILGDEYPTSKLTALQRAELWLNILNHLESGISDSPFREAIEQLLMWTQFNSLGALQSALKNPDLYGEVIKNLGNACRVGLDCKRKLAACFQSSGFLTECLSPRLEAAMGINLLNEQDFLKLTDQWTGLLAVPEQELMTAFGPLLEKFVQAPHGENGSRAEHMLGWIKGEPLASALYMLDRIPKPSRASPPTRLLDPLMDATFQAVRHGGEQAAAALLPELLHVRIGPDYANTLLNLLLEKAPGFTLPRANPAESMLCSFLELKETQNSQAIIKALGGEGLHSNTRAIDLQKGLENCLRKLDQLAGSGGSQVPPLLKGLITKKAGSLSVDCESSQLSWCAANTKSTIRRGGTILTVSPSITVLQQKGQNASSDSLNVVWTDGTLFSGTLAPDTRACSGRLISQLDHNKVQDNPLLQTGRALCRARWPLSAFNVQTLSAEGEFDADQLLNADNLSMALKSLKEGLIEENDPLGNLHVEFIVERCKPIGCIAVNHSNGQQAGLQMRFEPAGPEAPDPLGKSHGVRAVTEDIARDFSIVFLPLPTATLSYSSAWDTGTNTLSGHAQIHASGQSPFVWQGELDQEDQLKPGGVLQLTGTSLAVRPYTDTSEPQCIPIRFLPVMADVMGPALRQRCTFEPRIHLSQTQWPEPGFQGFVSELNCDAFRFSGYIGAGGRAIGLLKVKSGKDQMFSDRAIRGNFLIDVSTPSPGFKGLRNVTNLEPLVVQLPDGRALSPHGYCEHYSLDYHNVSAQKAGQFVYFKGVGLRADRITRRTSQIYDAPGASQYYSGTDLEFNGKAAQVDVVINAGDGAPDFLWIRPPGYERNPRYQAHYFTTAGYHASLLMLDQKLALAKLEFPLGLIYQGQIGFLSPTHYGPFGKGKIEKDTLRFSGHFHHDKVISELVAGNDESADLLYKAGRPQNQTMRLDALIGQMFGRFQNYGGDVQSHMRQRDFRHLHASAQVFKPEPQLPVTLRELQRMSRLQT